MDKVRKISYIKNLEVKQAAARIALAKINDKMDESRGSCNHLSVDLGYYGLFPSTGDLYCCVLCGMGKNHEFYYEPGYMVNAKDYLPQYNIRDDSQLLKKFDCIQELALEVLKENPNMENKELVTKLNNLIEKSTSSTLENDQPKKIKE